MNKVTELYGEKIKHGSFRKKQPGNYRADVAPHHGPLAGRIEIHPGDPQKRIRNTHFLYLAVMDGLGNGGDSSQ